MNICMVVCNNLTRDNRVLREAQTLQAAGHKVFVVGITAGDAEKPAEIMPDGVKLYRVDWRPTARRRLRIRAIPWGALILLLSGLAIWGSVRLAVQVLARDPWSKAPELVLILACALLIVGSFFVLWRAMTARASAAREARNVALRKTGAISAENGSKSFPPPRSWIPSWVPPALIDALAIPLAILGPRFRQFALSQERARQMAALCILLKPDVIHAHDCTALPIAALVKKALRIPVVYDAHEIYAEVAARRRGVVDYYILLHRRYLPIVDRFITVNESIAQYYRQVHPELSPAIVIRNAATRMPDCDYDGRLHEAAGLPRSEKILLYQGGFTARRGLPELLRSASRLPDGWTLVMMGWGPLEDELREIASMERSGAGSDGKPQPAARKVIFIPGAPRADVLLWTAGATVGIIPYEGDILNHWFCTPNKLWEFPSAGVPLIVQPFPELRKVIEKYGCGWILPETCTPETLAEMLRGLTDAQFCAAREGCRKFIEEDSWEAAYMAPLTQLYDSLKPSDRPVAGIASADASAAALPIAEKQLSMQNIKGVHG